MGSLAFYGHVSPVVYSEQIRKRGLTYRQARRLNEEVLKLRKIEIDLQIKLAVLAAGGKPR